MPDYHNPNVIGLARARAAKWMAQLFKPQHFSDIMMALDPVPNKKAFDVACQNAGLNECEIDWLWNYLKECKYNFYDCLPEAAASGW